MIERQREREGVIKREREIEREERRDLRGEGGQSRSDRERENEREGVIERQRERERDREREHGCSPESEVSCSAQPS